MAVTVRGINSARGVIRLVICPPDAGFPDCKTSAVRSANMIIANGQASAQFSDLPAGVYGIGVYHDANSNGKLDTFMGIPREGYGFSRNPPFRPRAPRFNEVEFAVHETTAESINLRYLM